MKKITEKYVTMSAFEKAMTSIAKSFMSVDENFKKNYEKLSNHDNAFALILKQMQTFTEEAREHRQNMSSLMRADVSQEKAIEDLQTRVKHLEMQIK